MARVNWVKIAQVLMKEYLTIEKGGYTCKLCGKAIEVEGDNVFSRLSSIYKHFKEEHSHVVEQVKSKVSSGESIEEGVKAGKVARLDMFIRGSE